MAAASSCSTRGRFSSGRRRLPDRVSSRRTPRWCASPTKCSRPGRPVSATIAFALTADGPAILKIATGDGTVVKTLSVNGTRGLNVATWDLLTDPAAGRPSRPAQPGEYRVTLTTGDRTAESTLRLDRFVRWTR